MKGSNNAFSRDFDEEKRRSEGRKKGKDASKLHHALSCCMPSFGMHPPEGTQRGSSSDHAREKGSRAVFALLEICSALTETLRLIDGDVAWLKYFECPKEKGW